MAPGTGTIIALFIAFLLVFIVFPIAICVTVKKMKPHLARDAPCPFGHETAWYVLKDESPYSVIGKLKLDIMTEINWKFGLAKVKEGEKIFVSPCLDGYVLVIGLTDPARDEVRSHALLFDELQYFCSRGSVKHYGWAKFQNHDLIRAYVFSGMNASGNMAGMEWNEGSFTAEELALGFDKFPAAEAGSSEENAVTPNEEDVLSIARAWGIDPKFENHSYKKSLGCLCKKTG